MGLKVLWLYRFPIRGSIADVAIAGTSYGIFGFMI